MFVLNSLFQNLYEDMKRRIDPTVAKGCISEEVKDEHKGFSEWSSKITKQDHHSIVQVITAVEFIIQPKF